MVSTVVRSCRHGELFAVLTEAFFDVPKELRTREPEIYEMLRDYYRQDPATW